MPTLRRQRYDEQTRRDAVREAATPGLLVKEVANRRGIEVGTLHRWVAEDRVEKKEASAWLMCSDWHLGALVLAKWMRGRHKYDTDVAKERVAALTYETLARVEALKHRFDVKHLTILWAGDIIDGTKAYRGQRYRLQLTTAGAQRRFAADLILPMLETLASRLSVSCVACEGNHGRSALMDDEEQGESYETRLFEEVAAEARGLAQWSVGNYEAENMCPTTGRVVVVEHGRNVPFSKHGSMTPGTFQHAFARQANVGKIVDVFAFGHRHTPAYTHGRPHILANGAMTGYSEFASEHGFRPCLPSQWFFGLTDDGLAWSDQVILGKWEESEADEMGMLSGGLE